jgi:glycosyltransferase involved in cell wall biosynthesis
MLVWIVEGSEPIPEIDGSFRGHRYSMLAKALVSRGHEVIWWSSTFCHEQKKHRFDGPRDINLRPGLRLRLLHGPGYDRNISPRRFRHQRIVAGAFALEASRDGRVPELVITALPTLEQSEMAVAYGKLHNVPVVVDVRDLWPDLYLTVFPGFIQPVARFALRSEFQRAKRVLAGAAAIVAVSDSYLDWGVDFAGRARRPNDRVFPLGYSTSESPRLEGLKSETLEFMHGIPSDSLVVTFIGAFGASYDLKTVIRAASLLDTDEAANVRIALAGGGDQQDKLVKMARNSRNVIFTGWLNQNSLLTLMKSSSVGLCAYTPRALQSLPNKPFEYMAMGLPLVSSLQGELRQLIETERIGLQYEAGNPRSLAEAILWLRHHEQERRAMGVRARALFEEKFDAKRVYGEFVDYLENLPACLNKGA